MRIVSWNLHGAAVETQLRAWDYMREMGADVILAQEVAGSAVPDWSDEGWDFVVGEPGRNRKNWPWGSVIAAKRELKLVEYQAAMDDPWLRQLYDLVLVGQIEVKGEPVVVASVHSVATPVRYWLGHDATSLIVNDSDYESLRRPYSKEVPFVNDLAFVALARVVDSWRFVVAGDWNTSRQFKGGPEFFARAKAYGWVECHPEPVEPLYLGRDAGEHQLDHAFVDPMTAAAGVVCRLDGSEVVRELSDHGMMVVEVGG